MVIVKPDEPTLSTNEGEEEKDSASDQPVHAQSAKTNRKRITDVGKTFGKFLTYYRKITLLLSQWTTTHTLSSGSVA
jgi:hypothetical protein